MCRKGNVGDQKASNQSLKAQLMTKMSILYITKKISRRMAGKSTEMVIQSYNN